MSFTSKIHVRVKYLTHVVVLFTFQHVKTVAQKHAPKINNYGLDEFEEVPRSASK